MYFNIHVEDIDDDNVGQTPTQTVEGISHTSRET